MNNALIVYEKKDQPKQYVDLNNRSLARFISSISLKAVILIFVIAGLACSYAINTYNRWFDPLMYYTNWSSIFTGIVTAVFITLIVIQQCVKRQFIEKGLLTLKLSMVVATTLTGLTYDFVLAFMMNNPFGSFESVALHIIVPVLAIVDLLVFDASVRYSRNAVWYVVIFPIVYLIFVIICYYCGLKFFDLGNKTWINAPYFFLDFGSPSGWFKFVSPDTCTAAEYSALNCIGCFWWILIITAIVSGIGFLYVFLLNIICQSSYHIRFKNIDPLVTTKDNVTNVNVLSAALTVHQKSDKKVKRLTTTKKVTKSVEVPVEEKVEKTKPIQSADISDESYNVYTSLLSKTKKIDPKD